MSMTSSDLPETKVCVYEECGATFARGDRSPQHWARMRYCSPGCVSRKMARERSIAAGAEDEKTCANPECGKTFKKGSRRSRSYWLKQKYCSQQCASTVRRKEDEAKPPPAPPEPRITTCKLDECGKQITTPKSKRSPAYCSDTCRNQGRRRRLDAVRNRTSGRPGRPLKVSRFTPSGLARPVFPEGERQETWRPPGFSRTVDPMVGRRKAS